MVKNKKVKMSPAARKLAKQMGINVGELEGSSGIIRTKDILDRRNQEYLEEVLAELSYAVENTKDILSDRYSNILAEERKTQSYLSWKEAKDQQTAVLTSWLISHDLERIHEERSIRQAISKKLWEIQKNVQTKRRLGYYTYLTDLKREEREKSAERSWAAAKTQQTERRRKYNAALLEEKRAERAKDARDAWAKAKAQQAEARKAYDLAHIEEKRAAKAKDAYASWAKAKAEQTEERRIYYAVLNEGKRAERAKTAYKAWAEAKAEQTAARYAYNAVLTEEKRAAKAKDSYKAWAQAKADQTEMRFVYNAILTEEKRAARAKDAYNSWVQAKADQTEMRFVYNACHTEEKRTARAKDAHKAWAKAKAEQTAARFAYNVVLAEEKRAARAKEAYKAWAKAKADQTENRFIYSAILTEEKRAARAKDAHKAWIKAKAEQTEARFVYNAIMTEEKRAERAKEAHDAWAKAKALMDIRTRDYYQGLEDAKIMVLWEEKKLAARNTWEELKSDGDSKIELFNEVHETRKFNEAYDNYVSSLDDYNQVSVGRIEFDADPVYDALRGKDMSFSDAVVRYVAAATAKALIDLECPIYENGLMNVVALTGSKPIKVVKDAHEGDFTDLEFEDAIYFTRDIRIRLWDLSACGLESFHASQGGINVYINIDDDEVELDVAIDTSVMMDLEALIFLMRMKEYLND